MGRSSIGDSFTYYLGSDTTTHCYPILLTFDNGWTMIDELDWNTPNLSNDSDGGNIYMTSISDPKQYLLRWCEHGRYAMRFFHSRQKTWDSEADYGLR